MVQWFEQHLGSVAK